ncbi:hypothetical protein HHI36_009285 [Cryptolaemus montrouzieri]|uniref:Uncharacterized protein n=2 Tax=Cryptolaemus montrouzieri TaxID=559131 RepID=A0ABD2MVN8_9CUCU
MEKRRRARINQCLNEIKSLVLEAMNKDPSRHSKLEKADILEMAVKHLQSIQRQQLAIAMASDPSVVRKFKAGFNDCAEEIDKCLNQIEGLGNSLKQGLSSHLRKCMSGIEHVAHMNFPDQSQIPFLENPNIMGEPKRNIETRFDPSNNRGDCNNNPYFRVPQGLQLVPERLRPGELTILLSNVTNTYNFSNSTASQIAKKETPRPSAFATVIPASISSKLLSPPLSPKQFQIPEEHSTSPLGFRPVQPNMKPVIAYASSRKEDEPQVCQISSTSTSFGSIPEIKTMKFPMQNFHEKKAFQAPAKIIEPLCIITNQSERFKQAQIKEDSAYFEENVQRGVKRKFGEMHQGLLTTAQESSSSQKDSNIVPYKIERRSPVNQAVVRQNEEIPPEMWRPW